MTNLVLAAMAAALVASFRSFPIAFAAGVGIGVGQTLLTNYVTTPGVPSALPFAIIILVMVVRGQALPVRGYFLQKLPGVGSGRVKLWQVAVGVLLAVGLTARMPTNWQDAMVTTFAVAIVLLSVVVITGYTGQLSLAQFALAGFGAWVAGRLVDVWGWPFMPALIVGALASVPLGAIFAVPAVRGPWLEPGDRHTRPRIDALPHGLQQPQPHGRLRRHRGGQADPVRLGDPGHEVSVPVRVRVPGLPRAAVAHGRADAPRTNRPAVTRGADERTRAAALGISVPGAKIYAFALSAGIAAVGGTLLAFRKDTIVYASEFTNFTSITAVGWAFVGGIGYLMGPFIGATLAPGSLGARISDAIFSGFDRYLQVIGGAIVILLVLQNQDGVAKETAAQLKWIGQQIWGLVPNRLSNRTPPQPAAVTLPPERRERVAPKVLEVRDLTVRYGGVTAVDTLSLTVQPGRVTGLIGPNGAGKTSAIDAITGFTPARSGLVFLDGKQLNGLSPAKRAHAGLSRSFQSLELFEDSTVLDNLRAASDPRDRLSYLRDLLHPVNPPLPGEVVAAIHEFKLQDDLDRIVQDLPYGQRRLLAIARAVATRPSVLLLDEPAAGLGDAETAELGHLVRRLADDWNMAILLVEHDMNFVMNVCDEIVVLDFGLRIAAGTPDAIRRDPKVIAAYLGQSEEAPIEVSLDVAEAAEEELGVTS